MIDGFPIDEIINDSSTKIEKIHDVGVLVLLEFSQQEEFVKWQIIFLTQLDTSIRFFDNIIVETNLHGHMLESIYDFTTQYNARILQSSLSSENAFPLGLVGVLSFSLCFFLFVAQGIVCCDRTFAYRYYSLAFDIVHFACG